MFARLGKVVIDVTPVTEFARCSPLKALSTRRTAPPQQEGNQYAHSRNSLGRRIGKRARHAPGSGHQLLAVAVLCVIFGLQIVAVMRTPGGPQAYQAIATEGMQQQ